MLKEENSTDGGVFVATGSVTALAANEPVSKRRSGMYELCEVQNEIAVADVLIPPGARKLPVCRLQVFVPTLCG